MDTNAQTQIETPAAEQPTTASPVEQQKTIVKTRYTYDVYQRGFYVAPIFQLQFIEANPEKVMEKANTFLAQNSSDAKAFTLQLKSIEALEEF